MSTSTILAAVRSSFPLGLDAVLVDVQAVPSTAAPSVFAQSAAAAREAAIRLRSALAAVDEALPEGVAIQLSDHPTMSVQLDLARALAILVAAGRATAPEGLLVLGELGLDGSVRAVRGVLAAVLAARAAGLRGAIVPAASAWEARIAEGMTIYGVADLGEALAALRGERAASEDPAPEWRGGRGGDALDFATVRGQDAAVRALARAVARGDGVLLQGPPGTGKTMLARRLTTILPEMTRDEQIGVARAYSAVGMLSGLPAADARPFRAPHHTISTTALVGEAGSARRPGELQLAGHGVLFLDELTEFSSGAIGALAVALRRMDPPERPQVVAAATPCPCGWLGSDTRTCACSADAIGRHRSRVSAFVDALELGATVQVLPVSLADLRASSPGPSSAELQALAFGCPIATEDLVGGEA